MRNPLHSRRALSDGISNFLRKFGSHHLPWIMESVVVFFLLASTSVISALTTDGPLKMEPITAYNFVVDSNVESPSSYSPSAAHLGVKITNTGTVPLTNIVVRIGDLLNPLTSTGTPGVFPSRTVSVSGSGGYSGTFALQMPGGPADAVRTIPSLAPGASVVQYFFVTYPLKDAAGNSVAGAGPDPGDDLWLNYDFWASAEEGAVTRRVSETPKVTMRNEISAMANKIWPNTTSKVPDVYLDAIQQTLGWRPDTSTPQAGARAQMEGIWYDLGNVGAGFDNNGDGIPDRNAWMQPVGDPSLYDPLAVRLVKCYGILIIKLNDGTEQLIPFEDRLYFENIPANNTGAVGLVFYEFMPLASGRTAQLTPYQEVASGYDNEKFNGDYGNSVGGFTSTAPSVTFDKTGTPVVTAGGVASFSLTAGNTGTQGLGIPELSLPFTFEDTVPSGLVYVPGSATSSNTIPSGNSVNVFWSTDGGATWLASEPPAASVTGIRWILASPLAAGATATVGFQASLPITYPSVTVNNTAVIKLGPTGELATDSTTSLVSGINSIGDFIWRDLDRDGVQDGGAETGIADVTVTLHYDADGNGVLGTGDLLYATTQTNASGLYSFSNLPDGRFIVVVDDADTDLPAGYSLPSSATTRIAVNLDATRSNASPVAVLTADWPFIGALGVVKSTSPTTYGSGDLITYTIDLENNSSAVAPKSNPVQTSWSTTVTANRAAQNPANAQGAPDSVYARIDQTASADSLTNSGLSFASPTGTITKVEMVFNAYLSQALIDDRLDVSIGGTLFSTLTTAQLNAMTGAAAIRSVDITSLNANWNWLLVQALTGSLRTNKTSSGDPGILWVDSIGFRVTTAAAPPTSGTYGPNTMDPLPLVDTYDAARLQYVSASVAPTSVAPGTITWSNLGPLNAGARRSINVTFRALVPPDTNGNGEPDSTTTVNTATSSNARFVSGRATNSATGTATVTINPRGSIGDLVWWDINANGIKDSSEPGIANVLVSLDNGAQTRTDANGAYLFTGLQDGTYTVSINTGTLPWSSFSQTRDPDATFNNASTVTINNNDGISTNNSYLDRDFGYDSTLNVISGTIFQDNDGDGIQDPGENVLAGVTVTLGGTSSATTTTNSSGFYSFGSLANGTYTVTVTQPGSTTQTLDPDATVNNATTVAASGGNLYPNRDFAYRPSGTLTLGDTLYVDWNGDGDQDVGEEGIAGVDVFLYEDSDGNGVVDPEMDALIATSVTGASGLYGFTGLPAASYVVVVNVADPQFPSSVIQVQDYDGTRDSRAVVNLTASLSNADFGYRPVGSGSIGDTVFRDLDGDGAKDPIEPGISNVTVTLYEDTNNNSVIDVGTDAVIAIVTTGPAGGYLFSGLAAGNYLVDVDQNAAAIPSDSYGNKFRLTTADPQRVVLGAGQAWLTADFGFAAPGTIGDFVFFDSNGNGTQDFSETGIPNVTVELYADADQNGLPDSTIPVATTVTASGFTAFPAGFYQFTNLPAGTWFVKVRTSTLPLSGGLPIPLTSDPDRDGVPVADNTYPGLPAGDHADSLVIVSLGGNYSGADFGYQPSGALGDFVWLDLDQDGVQDSGEPGIPGVAMSITNGVTTYNAVTDPDGYWSVANVPDGNWTVTVAASNFLSGAALADTTNTWDADGGTNSSVAMVLTNGVVNLATGNLGFDFGYALNGSYSISGTVITHDTKIVGTADDIDDFFDDGVDQDAGILDEIELEGIVVYLYSTGGDFLGSTTTDAAGNYRFNGLPGGGYRVIISTTNQALRDSTLTTTAANNPAVSSVNASSGTSVIQTLGISTANVSDVDFAFVSNVNYDYGDLPLVYGITTLAQDGARHIIPSGGSLVHLGSAPDADTNGMPSALANGDDVSASADEQGITPISPTSWSDGTVAGGHGGSIQANVTGTGWLVGWIDWNQDGDFLDAGEFVVNRAVTSGTVTAAFDIPSGTVGSGSESWLSRFRIFTTEPAYPLFSFTGVATDGEVEDYLIEKPVGSSIGDLVWNDANSNGILDSSENGIGGITLQLRDGANSLIGTQVTGDGSNDVDGDGTIDPVGYYRFRSLGAGTYTIAVTAPPAGFTPSYDENGTSTANVTTVTLATGVQHLSADFGYAPLTANISGQVRYDLDSDGDFNDPDSGAMVVRIQLWTDPNGDGSPVDGVQVGETYTDASGNYLFSLVPSGRYVVVEINPPGTTSTADVSGANDDRIAVNLIGTNVTGRDFLDSMPPVYSISGTVYDDDDATNNNVIGVGDGTISLVTVKLYLDRDSDGLVSAGDSLLGTTATGSLGTYSFSGLPAGKYVVEEVDPSGATSDWDAADILTDNQIGVTLVDQNVTGRDFLDDGYLGMISGTVRSDIQNDGTPDLPVSGVTISLRNSGGTVIATTVTLADGSYSFTNVTPGNYSIAQTQPVGYLSVSDIDGGNPDLIGNGSPVVLTSGASITGQDFLERPQACPNTWAGWQAKWNLSPNDQPGDNPDGDMFSNLIEYAFCLPPTKGIRSPFCMAASLTDANKVDAVYTRTAGGALDVTYELQYIASLSNSPGGWTTIPLPPASLSFTYNTNGTETIRIRDLESITGLTSGTGFVRLRVSLDANGDSTYEAQATTEVGGWVKSTLGTNCRTYNNPFISCPVFSGTIDSVSGSDLVLTSSGGGTDLSTVLAPGSSYYVEITSGLHEGQRFDVAAGGVNSLTLANDASLPSALPPFNTMIGAPPSTLAGATFSVRKHWTLGTMFPTASFLASDTQTTADQIQVFAGGAWTSYWLYDDDLLSTANTLKWLKIGVASTDDQSGVVIPPGQGSFINCRQVTGSLLAFGKVRENDFVRPVFTGANLVGGGYPLAQSPASRSMTLAGGFDGDRDYKMADMFYVWRGDAVANAAGYDTYYLLEAGTALSPIRRWVKVGDALITPRDATNLFLMDRAVFLDLNQDLPGQRVAAPWAP